MNKKDFMLEAIKLSSQNLTWNKWWPFGAVIVRNWKIIWRWKNQVTWSKDPTAHAEIQAIRDACKKINNFDLSDCEIYTSCQPCPMCLWAIYRSKIKKIYYWNTEKDARSINFRDDFIYKEFAKKPEKRELKSQQILHKEAIKVFEKRKIKKDKKMY